MTDNESQKTIIARREGFVVVDAGPGTGKTHTVTARCMEILRDGLKGQKRRVAMLTFTKNAAAEMQERLIGRATKDYMDGIEQKPAAEQFRLREEYKRIVTSIREMFVGTFDSFCLSIVKRSPGTISRFFRFDEELTSSASTTENETINRVFFRRFISEWLEEYGSDGKYGDYPAIIASDPLSVYQLIERLMCMGIIPLKSGGWFGSNLRKHSDDIGPAGEPLELRGNPELVEGYIRQAIDDYNAERKNKKPVIADDKCINSSFADGYDRKNPTYEDAASAAREDRGALLRTIHDIYYEFIRKSVSCDHLTFGLTACFAFIILYENSDVREGPASYDYLIVDEFQDTNTLQMMISMMVLKNPNLCVVGDWRQGIYGFRYVSVENITEFESRLRSLRSFLNDDGVQRVRYPIPDDSEIARIQLSTSYRSSRAIIHTSYTALTVKATENEEMDPEVSQEIMAGEISPGTDDLEKDTWIKRVQCGTKEDEVKETVRRIISFVRDRTRVFDRDRGCWREARYGDVAVLCRKTESCRMIYRACRRYNIPAFLQGDMQIMNTSEGKILLAWLKYVENKTDTRGIVPILAFMGYSANEIAEMTSEDGSLPPQMESMRKLLLRKTRRLSDFTATVYGFHGIDNDISQAISDVISTAHRDSLMTISEVISMIEEDIRNRTSYPVDGHPDSNAVIIQTAHKSKGLEYPLVIIPFLDSKTFPSSSQDRGLFLYSETMGIRCTKTLVTMANGDVVMDDSWKTSLVRKCLPRDYNEERRLFFVALSRAKQYVCLIASNGSAFFKNINHTSDSEPGTDEIAVQDVAGTSASEPPVLPPARNDRPISMAVHAIMGLSDETDFEGDKSIGKGMNYGTRVHRAAQMMVDGTEISEKAFEEMPELAFIRKVVEKLRGNYMFNTELQCSLHLDVRGRKVALNGNIDLLAVGADKVLVYDWKTDASRKYADEYRLQLSVYAACAKRYYPDKKVEAFIVWTSEDIRGVDPVELIPESGISDKVIEALDVGKD